MDYSDEEYAPPSSRRAARRVSLCSSSSPVDVSRVAADRSTFPFKLYEMLEYASDHGHASIVWLHDGEAFEIIDADALMDGVAPLFFKQSKFRSFTRQLNIWGFNRLEDSKKGWRHDNFIRGDVDAIALIKRIEIKGKSTASKKRKRSRRAPMASKESYISSVTALPEPAASVGSVSESEVSSISSSAEPPLEVLTTDTPSSTVPSEPTHEAHEIAQDSPQQLEMPGHLSVPSQVSYNPTSSTEYIQYTPAFLAQTTAPLIQSLDPISASRNSMSFGVPSSNDFMQFAQMMEAEEEDAFDVAVRKMFS